MGIAAPKNYDKIIPLDIAKETIISAILKFDEGLGRRAADILHSDRLNVLEEHLEDNPYKKRRMMQCRPRGLTKAVLEAKGMYNEHFEEEFGPHFTEQENITDHAIIDFEYNYTKDSVIYLAHELGHAIADGIQKEHSRTFRDFTDNQLEEQAYFVQSIVSESVAPDFNKQSASFKNPDYSTLSNVFNREGQRNAAQSTFEQSKSIPPEQRGTFIVSLMGGKPTDDKKNDGGGKLKAAPAGPE